MHPITDISDGEETFLLDFTVYNPSEQPVRLLRWNTPFEGSRGELFEVRSATGKRMRYLGLDAKRALYHGRPPGTAYIEIKPGSSRTARINPTRSYEWDGDGYYYIRVKQQLHTGTLENVYGDVMRSFTKALRVPPGACPNPPSVP